MSLPSSVPLIHVNIAEICGYIPPWTGKTNQVPLLRKFVRFMVMVVDRPFLLVDDHVIPDMACCEATVYWQVRLTYVARYRWNQLPAQPQKYMLRLFSERMFFYSSIHSSVNNLRHLVGYGNLRLLETANTKWGTYNIIARQCRIGVLCTALN